MRREQCFLKDEGEDEKLYTVDLIILACLDFREFVIFLLFVMSRICELSISMIGSNIIIIFARFLNSRIYPREIHENQKLVNITRSTVYVIVNIYYF